jgi:hypothetical protein
MQLDNVLLISKVRANVVSSFKTLDSAAQECMGTIAAVQQKPWGYAVSVSCLLLVFCGSWIVGVDEEAQKTRERCTPLSLAAAKTQFERELFHVRVLPCWMRVVPPRLVCDVPCTARFSHHHS